MTLEEYELLATRTRAGEANVTVAALGLAGEAGEFADHVKKWLAQGHDLDYDKLEGELGDILWYVAMGAAACGVSLEYIARRNVEKLRARYPEGFTREASVNRVN